jgi:two-component system chemotaxis response regulator CheY
LRLIKKPEKLKIMIIEGDDDNLSLYSDYLSNRGYDVIARYTKGNNILSDFEKQPPDVFVLDSKLSGNKSGTEVATEILDVYPSAPILMTTADYGQPAVVKKHPKLCDKKVEVLLKPVKLDQIENTIMNLVSN